MKASKVLSLVLSLVVVAVLAGAGLLFANDRALHLSSEDASLVSDTYTVGTAYAGSIQEVYVERGSAVTAGQDLFRLQSATLQQALQTSRFNSAGVGYRVDGDDVLVFSATKDGTVGQLEANVGSFVPANTIIATIDIANTLHLKAHFTISARDYARLPVGGTVAVALPDDTTVDAQVYDVSIESDSGEKAQTTVLARGDLLSGKGYFTSGAPVSAQLTLSDTEGLGNWFTRQVAKLVQPGGFSEQ